MKESHQLEKESNDRGAPSVSSTAIEQAVADQGDDQGPRMASMDASAVVSSPDTVGAPTNEGGSAALATQTQNVALGHTSGLQPSLSTAKQASRSVEGAAIRPGAVAVAGIDRGIRRDSAPTMVTDETNRIGTDDAAVNVASLEPPSRAVFSPPSAAEDEGHSSMVVAELVVPPVEALHVAIDEEPSSRGFAAFETEQARNQSSAGGRNRTPLFWVVLALVLVVVVCALAIPFTLRSDNLVSASSQAPTFSYPCYTSTFAMLEAQLADGGSSVSYIICPGTIIYVGNFNNPAVNDFRFVDGDYPLVAVRENVTIQCGQDGRQENNCTIKNGFMHVLTMQTIPLPDGSGLDVNATVDNLLFKGITFTGIPVESGPVGGISVSLSHPGKNIRFENCLWTDIAGQNGLIGVYRNYFQILTGLPLKDRSIDVTFSDCIFQKIVYDTPLIYAVAQNVTLERCIFRDIRMSALVTTVCNAPTGNETIQFFGGCGELLHCAPGSSCLMKDICVKNFEFQSVAMVVSYDETEFQTDRLYLSQPLQEDECELATVHNLDPTNTTCSTIFTETTCPIPVK